jgi:hypothetical protein
MNRSLGYAAIAFGASWMTAALVLPGEQWVMSLLGGALVGFGAIRLGCSK